MSDRAIMYRLAQDGNIQFIMDLFDLVVDEYVGKINELQARAEKAEAELASLREHVRYWEPFLNAHGLTFIQPGEE